MIIFHSSPYFPFISIFSIRRYIFHSSLYFPFVSIFSIRRYIFHSSLYFPFVATFSIRRYIFHSSLHFPFVSIFFHSSLYFTHRHIAADNKTMNDVDGTTDAVPIDLPLTRYQVVTSVTSQHSVLYK